MKNYRDPREALVLASNSSKDTSLQVVLTPGFSLCKI